MKIRARPSWIHAYERCAKYITTDSLISNEQKIIVISKKAATPPKLMTPSRLIDCS